MLKIFISCFCIFILGGLTSFAKSPKKVEVKKDQESPKTAEYDSLQIDNAGNIFMSGNVEMNYEEKKIFADNIAVLNAKTKEYTVLQAYDNIKLIEEGNLVRGRSLLYSVQEELALIRFAFLQQMQKTENEDGKEEDSEMTIFASELQSRGKVKTMDNVILTACFPLIKDKEGFLNECFVNNTYNFGNKYDLNIVRKRYNKLPWFIEVQRLEMDDEKQKAKLHNLKFNVYGVPIFKIPYITYPTNMLEKGSGSNGFLMPRPILMGRRQQGLEIPYYHRFGDNKDLITGINLYGQIPVLSKESRTFTDPSMNILDNNRMRENFLSLNWRHLIDNNFGKNSFYTIEGAITDKTQLIDDNRRAELDANGNNILGHRGYGAFNGLFWLSKDTSLRANYINVTDPNFMFIYLMDMKSFTRNNISLSKVNDTVYAEMEINQFKGITSYINQNTTPINTMFSSDIKLDMPKNFGRVNIDNSFSKDDRENGFSRERYITQATYKLPFATQGGSLFSFNSNIRGDWYQTKYNAYDNTVVNPNSTNSNSIASTRLLSPDLATNFIFGNYAYLMENSFYTGLSTDMGSQNQNFNRTLSTISLDFEHPFIKEFKSGSSLVVSPKFMIRKNSGSFGVMNMTNEDGFDSRVNYSSLFAMNSFASRDIVDIGTHAIGVMEAKFKNKDDNGLEFGFGKMHRLADETTQDLPIFTGFRNSASDYLSYANIDIGKFRIQSQQRFAQEDFSTLENRVGVSWLNDRTTFNVDYTMMAKNASFVNREINFLTLNAQHYITETYRLETSLMYNLSTEPSVFNAEGKAALIRASIGIMKDLKCMEYGFRVSRADLNIPGLENHITMRFIFGLKGL